MWRPFYDPVWILFLDLLLLFYLINHINPSSKREQNMFMVTGICLDEGRALITSCVVRTKGGCSLIAAELSVDSARRLWKRPMVGRLGSGNFRLGA